MDNERTFDEVFDEVLDALLAFLEEKKYKDARDLLITGHNGADVAELMESIIEKAGVDKTIILFRMLPKDMAVDVFAYLPIDDQLSIINGITDREISYIMEEMDFDDMIDVMEELPANLVDKILEKTPKDERKLINTFLNYPDDCAGSIMTPDYISLRRDMTVGEALAYIKKVGMDTETIYTCYVKESGRKLIGIVSLRTLVLADDSLLVGDIMHGEYVYVNVYDDQEEVSEAFKKYGFLAIPVVDKEHRLVGIITVDDILDVIEEEATEDFERIAGILDGSDREYLDMSIWQHAKSRLPWLLLLTLSAMVTGAIITRFETVLSKVISLVAYLPLLMGTGGNTGSQASTLIIRGMAIGDLEPSDVPRVLFKEFRISLVVGLVLSSVNFLKILLLDGEGVLIALTVSCSMLIIVCFAKMIGGLLPMAAKKIGVDPALMANPMISSITDMVSVLTYFLLATVLLGI